jgi:hypothetical protein
MLLLAAMATTTTAETFLFGTWCSPNDGALSSEAACRSAAGNHGIDYMGEAGGEWHSGCIVHHGASLSFFPGTCTSSVTMISFFSSIV